jgi:hypothetical protein
MVELPDGTRIPDRRRDKARVLQRVVAEPLASVAIGLTLATLAWGTITSNTRNAREAEAAKINSKVAADNAKAAETNAEAARSLAATIHAAQDQLARVGEASRRTTFDTHQAMQDTLVCILSIQPAQRTQKAVEGCVKPLRPPVSDPNVKGP